MADVLTKIEQAGYCTSAGWGAGWEESFPEDSRETPVLPEEQWLCNSTTATIVVTRYPEGVDWRTNFDDFGESMGVEPGEFSDEMIAELETLFLLDLGNGVVIFPASSPVATIEMANKIHQEVGGTLTSFADFFRARS